MKGLAAELAPGFRRALPRPRRYFLWPGVYVPRPRHPAIVVGLGDSLVFESRSRDETPRKVSNNDVPADNSERDCYSLTVTFI